MINKIQNFSNQYLFILITVSIIFLDIIPNIFLLYFNISNIFFIAKVIICLISVAFFFLNYKKPKLNLGIMLIFFLFLIYFANIFFEKNIDISINLQKKFLSYPYDSFKFNDFFNSSFKIIIISIFNFCLAALLSSTNIKLKLYQLEFSLIYISRFLIILLLFHFLYLLINDSNLSNDHFINFYNISSLLIINLALTINRLWKNNKINFFDFIFLIIIIFLSFLLKLFIVFFLIYLLFLYYLFFIKKNFKLFYILLIFNIILITYFIKIFFDKNLFSINLMISYDGSILYSIFIRIKILYYYIFYNENLNFFIGNNIFVKENFTYPHNFLADIFFTTGFFGISIIFFILRFIYKLFKNNPSNIIYILLFTEISKSLLNGFFFSNTSLIFLLTLCILKKFNLTKGLLK
jgi:hypothetical protein